MSERPRYLRVLETPPIEVLLADPGHRDRSGNVAFLHHWRAARIARAKALHPSTLARAGAVPALRTVPEPLSP
jgi:hypothetical protein